MLQSRQSQVKCVITIYRHVPYFYDWRDPFLFEITSYNQGILHFFLHEFFHDDKMISHS